MGKPKPTKGDVGAKRRKLLSNIGCDDTKQEAFITVTEWLEKSEEQYIPLTVFHEKMKELIDEPYTVKWTKSLLNKRYKDLIVFSAMQGCPDVMFFHQTTNALLYDFYRQDRC